MNASLNARKREALERLNPDCRPKQDRRVRPLGWRSLLGAGIATLAALTLVTDAALSEDISECAETTGAATVWDNGAAAAASIRSQGVDVDDRDVVDQLINLPEQDALGNRAMVCATERTGIIGSFMPIVVEVSVP